MLKTVRVLLLVLFFLTAAAFSTLVVYQYTHNDISPPAFDMDTDYLEVSVNDGNQALLQGLRAYDNIDGDVTDRIQVMQVSKLINNTDATVTYLVFDQASNTATCTRTIHYTDYTKPKFGLSKPLTFHLGEAITLMDRLTATDVLDGDITDKILLVDSAVNNRAAGFYRVEVSVTNSAGDTSSLPLTIIVENQDYTSPAITLSEQLIYLPVGSQPDFAQYLYSARDPMAPGRTYTDQVTINDEDVDLNTPGAYEVSYYYTGKSGATATAILTVVVE